jgi:hypothetical protein
MKEPSVKAAEYVGLRLQKRVMDAAYVIFLFVADAMMTLEHFVHRNAIHVNMSFFGNGERIIAVKSVVILQTAIGNAFSAVTTTVLYVFHPLRVTVGNFIFSKSVT